MGPSAGFAGMTQLLKAAYGGMKTIPAGKLLINTLLTKYIRLMGETKMDGSDEIAHLRGRQLKAAMEHLEARRWRLAEVQCRILLAVDTSDVEALLILGLAIAASGEAARAAPILDRVRRARPNRADPCRDLEPMEPRVPRSVVPRQYRASLKLTPGDTRLRRDFATYL